MESFVSFTAIDVIPLNETAGGECMSQFKISDNFLSKYKRKKAPFGFNGLGELVYQRTYSRLKVDGKNEQWWETVQRVVEGTFNMQASSTTVPESVATNFEFFSKNINSR